MGWLFGLSGAAYAGTAAVTAWVTAARTWGWPGLLPAAWVSEWLYVLALGPQLTLLLLLFPDGAPPSRRWRPLTFVACGLVVALVVASATVPRIRLGPDVLGGQPAGRCAAVVAAHRSADRRAHASAGWPASARCCVRLHRADGARPSPHRAVRRRRRARQSPRWPPRHRCPARAPYVQTVVLPLLPIAATLCVLRYRLYDLEVVVRRSVVWLGLTVLVVGGYAAVVAAVSNLLRREAGLAESLLAAGSSPRSSSRPASGCSARWGGRCTATATIRAGRSPTSAARSRPPPSPRPPWTRRPRRIAAALAVPWVTIEVARPHEAPVHTATSGSRPGWAAAGRR